MQIQNNRKDNMTIGKTSRKNYSKESQNATPSQSKQNKHQNRIIQIKQKRAKNGAHKRKEKKKNKPTNNEKKYSNNYIDWAGN